jgi:L-amino acid N-acyltransferase YncA
MSAAPSEIARQYPKRMSLSDGRQFTVRRMEATEKDKSSIIKFANALREEDLLYLRTDISDPAVVAQWVQNLGTGHTVTLIAEMGDEVAGYASVHREPARWTRGIGELRVNAAQRFRGVGLGRILVAEAFQLGKELGLRKLCGMLTPEQNGARTVFERLGFRVEASLQDWVEDRRGRLHDILVVTYEIDRSTNRAI